MQFRKTNLLKMALYVLLDNDCLIRVYQSFVVVFKIFPSPGIMLNAFSDLKIMLT